MKIRKFKKAAEGDGEQLNPEEGKSQKEIEKLLLQVIENDVSLLSYAFILGLSLFLIKANIGSKEELAKMKPQILTNKLYPILKMIAADRQSMTQELRLLWRYGAQRYAAKKIRELKGVIGNA